MMLDDRGVSALGKVSEERKLRRAGARRRALRALAGRRELRHGPDRGLRGGHAGGRLGHPRLPRRRARRASTGCSIAARATRSRWPRRCAGWRSTAAARADGRAARASAPSASPGRTSPPKWPSATSRRARGRRAGNSASAALAVRHGLAPADLLPRIPAQRLREPAGARPARRRRRRCGRAAARAAQRRPCWRARWPAGRARALALQHVGVTAWRRPRWWPPSRGSSPPASALMCASMFVRALAWHAILARGADLAPGETARRDAGHLHRRADVRDAAGPPRASPRAR